MVHKGKIVVIVGATASGKTKLAVEVAKKYDGEVICCDSRTIYRGLDIGTAKPTQGEQEGIKHWGIDLVNPNERYSAYDFKNYAIGHIEQIRSRGKLPVLVGGTGLYIDAILLNYKFAEANTELRGYFENMTVDELLEYCQKNNIDCSGNARNKRHIISRSIAYKMNVSKLSEPSGEYVVVGISTEKAELRARIMQRIVYMIDEGVVEEATKIASLYGWNCPGLSGNIYPLVHDFLDKRITYDELIDLATTKDYQLAKRQLTWFRRNKYINWSDLSLASSYIDISLGM